MKKLEDRAKNLMIPSSGDEEKDRAALLSAALHQSRMEANICPNGCGQMTWDDPHTRHCPVCSFIGWSNVAYDGAKSA